MATYNTLITPTQTRPCWVEGRRAIFHRWTDSARPVKARGMEEDENAERYQLHSVHALVEYEDGMEHQRDALPYTFDEVAEKKPTEENPDRKNCYSCAHNADNAEFCDGAGYNCDKCTVLRCVCKRCEEFNKWEPKGGTA